MVNRPDSGDSPEQTRAAQQQDNEKGPTAWEKVGSLIVNAAAVAASHEVGSWFGHVLISLVGQLLG